MRSRRLIRQSFRKPTCTMFILLFNLFLAGPEVIAQQVVHFSDGGYNKALEQSKTDHKPLFYYCYASWCPHSKKMRQELFTDPSVAEFYNRNFICVQQDMEKNEGIELHEQFKIKSYPTYIFIDSTGTTLYRLTGEFQPEQFVEEGKNAMTPSRQLPYLKKQFEKDHSNAGKCLDYLKALKRGGLDYSLPVQQYFATQTDRQLLSETNWRMIANGTTDFNSREFGFVLSHRDEFASIASRERVERKIYNLVEQWLMPLASANDTAAYFAGSRQAAVTGLYMVDSLLFATDIFLLQLNSNWKSYRDETMRSADRLAGNNFMMLSDIARVYLDHVPDRYGLRQALVWAKKSLALNAEYGTYLLCARLCLKLDENEEALLYARQAKELAESYGWDHKEADELLN